VEGKWLTPVTAGPPAVAVDKPRFSPSSWCAAYVSHVPVAAHTPRPVLTTPMVERRHHSHNERRR